MKVKHIDEMEADTYQGEDSQGIAIRVMISRSDGAPTFSTRYFEVAPGGHTPRHSHAWEHEVFVISGEGTVLGREGEEPLTPGTAVFVPPHEEHQFRNTGDAPLVFTCAVPHAGQS
jgi:quercetin dioxygenase-like cupin family protein